MMKTRLYGLLALVLCAMMVAAPVAAMGASGNGPFVTFEDGVEIVEGMLICTSYPNTSGNTLTINWHSNDNSGYSHTPATFGTLNQNEAWKVTEIAFTPSNAPTDAHIYVSKVDIIDIQDFSHNLDANGDGDWNKIITTTLGKYKANASSYADLVSKLDAALQKEGYTSLKSYFEITPYMEHDSGNFYTPYYNSAYDPDNKPFHFTLPVHDAPINDGLTYAVVHGLGAADNTDYLYQLLPAKQNDGSVSFEVDGLSPFAVGYKLASDDDDDTTTPGGGNGGGGNGGGTTNPGGGGNINPGGPGDRIPAPADPVAPSTPSIPQTGDNSQLALWFALAVLSLTGAVLALRRRKA